MGLASLNRMRRLAAEKQEKGAKNSSDSADIGTDSGSQFSEDELRKIIERETGKALRPNTKYETLVARFNELNQKADQAALT